MHEPLPIDAILDELIDALQTEGRAVLVAPPGAGKTTHVPLALLAAHLTEGRILMLEPRRLAARAAADRMADLLDEDAGTTVGYRMRGETKVSPQTRIEVVTEGILTRMLQDDPSLADVGIIIFDEFHERSLNADLGLALAWQARATLRPDLMIVVMSATLDAEPLAAMLEDAPVIKSEGRLFGIETRYMERPPDRALVFEAAAAELVEQAVNKTKGGVLAFLPGQGEIHRVAALLKGRLPAEMKVHLLYGAMDLAAQRAAIVKSVAARKLVLATSIAETSLTIEDIRVVVDCGRARRSRFDPGSGMQRLVTERASRAEADQRRGRAGRIGPGVCYRMWTKGEEGAMSAFAPAEIEVADLSGLALELALWGTEADGLAFLTPPPWATLAEAQTLLTGLDALDEAGKITKHGRAMAKLPLHPRLGHMLLKAGPPAAVLAALLADRDPLRGGPAELTLRLAAIKDPKAFAAEHGIPVDGAAVERIRAEAKRLERLTDSGAEGYSYAEMAALAYPDRIGHNRQTTAGRYVLSGGKGALVAPADPLERARLIVVTNLDGDPREAKVRQGTEITEGELRRLFPDLVGWTDVCTWSKREGKVLVRRQERFGALVLSDVPRTDAPHADVALAAIEGLRQIGLTFTEEARRYRARVEFLRREGADLPDFSDKALLARAESWLPGFLTGKRTEADLRALDLTPALKAALTHEQRALLDRLAPANYSSPLGRSVPIDYDGEHPAISIRLQEMFGTTEHPAVGPKRLAVQVTLLSPAHRPVQVTQDIPRFWASSYADVRRDMRGQYPKHPWPEDPTQAAPTLKVRPRGG